MKTSSAKAKGRVLQDKVRDMYREVGKDCGLVDGDIEPRPMGQNGVDLILSPRALEVFNHSIECKKHAQVRIPSEFAKHYKKYKDDKSLKLLFSENNHSEPLVTMQAVDFMKLIEEIIKLNEQIDEAAYSSSNN